MSAQEIDTELDRIIAWIEEHGQDMPTLVDMSDADMALMYLRHLRKHLSEV